MDSTSTHKEASTARPYNEPVLPGWDFGNPGDLPATVWYAQSNVMGVANAG